MKLFSLRREGMKRGFLVVPTGRTRGSRHKLKPTKFHLNIRKRIITSYQTLARVAHRGFYPRDIQTLTGHSPLADPALALMLDYVIFREVPYNLNYSVHQFVLLCD